MKLFWILIFQLTLMFTNFFKFLFSSNISTSQGSAPVWLEIQEAKPRQVRASQVRLLLLLLLLVKLLERILCKLKFYDEGKAANFEMS